MYNPPFVNPSFGRVCRHYDSMRSPTPEGALCDSSRLLLRGRSATPTRRSARQQLTQQQLALEQMERRRRQDSLIRSALQRPGTPRGRRWLGTPPPSPQPRPQPTVRHQQQLQESARTAARHLRDSDVSSTRHIQLVTARYRHQHDHQDHHTTDHDRSVWENTDSEDVVQRAHRRWKSTERDLLSDRDGQMPCHATRRYEVVWDRPWISYGFRRVWK